MSFQAVGPEDLQRHNLAVNTARKWRWLQSLAGCATRWWRMYFLMLSMKLTELLQTTMLTHISLDLDEDHLYLTPNRLPPKMDFPQLLIPSCAVWKSPFIYFAYTIQCSRLVTADNSNSVVTADIVCLTKSVHHTTIYRDIWLQIWNKLQAWALQIFFRTRKF